MSSVRVMAAAEASPASTSSSHLADKEQELVEPLARLGFCQGQVPEIP